MTALTDLYRIDQYIDSFAPGHYARVLEAVHQPTAEVVAFKVMRPDHLASDGEMRWEYRAFGSEAEILTRLAGSPQVVRLHDCGFVSTLDEAPAGGEIESFGTDAAAFVRAMPSYADRGWRPYLALENLPRTQNLFYLMKPNRHSSARRRLPSEEGLTLALQFANLLRMAHEQNIVYLDHKLEHVYWDGTKLRVIDFNSSRQLTGGAGDAQDFARDIHNLCVGILYPLFTGMSPQKGSLRPQAGGRDVVETRYNNIDELDFMMEPLLSQGIQDLLQRGAQQQIRTVDEFVAALQAVSAAHGRDFPAYYTSPSSRSARDQMRAGLKRLREGEASIREARDLFREAAVMDGITDDLEDELRRLVSCVNEMLNHRVIP